LVIEAIKSAKKAQGKHKRKRKKSSKKSSKKSAHHKKRSLSPKSLSPLFYYLAICISRFCVSRSAKKKPVPLLPPFQAIPSPVPQQSVAFTFTFYTPPAFSGSIP
jgi:hypothetical protein